MNWTLKTTFFTLVILLFTGWVHAETVIATFETGQSPLGTIIGSAANQTVFDMSTDNPDKTGLNTSDKCLYVLTKEGVNLPGWFGNNVTITFDTPINITADNQYLHILHLKERILHNWVVYGVDAANAQIEIARGDCPEANKWFDIVVNIKSKMDVIKKIIIVLDGNWGGVENRFYEATKFYYDEIILDNNPLPRGADVITRANLLNFEDSGVTDATVNYTVHDAAYYYDVNYDNSENTGLNRTDKCAVFKGNSKTPAPWWHGFEFSFKNPVDARGYGYLHVLMKKSVAEAQNVQISLVNLDGTQSAALMNAPLTTEWADYVVAIPATHAFFNKMYIKFNAQSAGTECYADEILLSNDPNPVVDQRQEQTINFPFLDEKLSTDEPFNLVASASSGLPVTFRVISGPAQISANTVTLTGEAGIVTVDANQPGNEQYKSSPTIRRQFYAADPTAKNVNPASQDYVDYWVATDALNRELPTFQAAGTKKENKLIGVFYYLWHGYHGKKVYDITKIIQQYPSDPLSSNNPYWGEVNEFHFWGEPEYGYFKADDPWVIRRDLQMLSNAKVDFLYLDVTNAVTYLETVKKLCNISMQMRKEGIYTPQIVFTTNSSSGNTMNKLYDEFYAHSLFKDLWFMWDGKPLILGDKSDPILRTDVKNFFTIKYSWAWTNTTQNPDHWQWLDDYPQDYGWSVNKSTPEQIPVSVAQHPGTTTGTSYHNGSSPAVNSQYLTNYTGQGLHAAEQWGRALAVNPAVIMVTQWNEWLAQRMIRANNGTYAGRTIKAGDTYFVDILSQEFNRDMAPMKGGHTDNYYYQLISNIRKYKGMIPPPTYSGPKTVTMDDSFSEWSSVYPVFKDPAGDTMHRNYSSYDPSVIYTNNTGRNDIIESRVTHDESNLYFYVKTAQDLTPHTDPNWMLLFINADKNKSTGWEGYDYLINSAVGSDTQTTLQQWNGSSWENVTVIPYKYKGNELKICVPREALSAPQTNLSFYFHWADNVQDLHDITAFFTDGESAPDRRFDYFYDYDNNMNPSTATLQNQNQLSIYPNPASDFLNVELHGTAMPETVQLLDLTGKVIGSYPASGKSQIQLITKHIDAGLYLLKTMFTTHTELNKIIIKH